MQVGHAHELGAEGTTRGGAEGEAGVWPRAGEGGLPEVPLGGKGGHPPSAPQLSYPRPPEARQAEVPVSTGKGLPWRKQLPGPTRPLPTHLHELFH